MSWRVRCPACGERVDVHPDVDTPQEGHTWMEDCEVCCRPMTLRLARGGGRRRPIIETV